MVFAIVVGDRLYLTGDVDDDLVIFAFDLRRPAAMASQERPRPGPAPYPGPGPARASPPASSTT